MPQNSSTKTKSRRLAVAAGVPLIALVMAACGSGKSTGTASSTTAGPTNSSAHADAPTGSFADNKAAGSPVKVGLINIENGPAISQPEAREAVQAVVEYANDHLGGIAGHRISLDVCKQQEDAASATACANQMVQDGVVAVVVPATGQGSLMVPIITKAGIAYVIPTGVSPAEYTTPGAFDWTGGLPGVLQAAAKYSKQQGYKSVSLFGVSSAAKTLQQIGVPIFAANGVQLDVISIAPGTPDPTPQVEAGLRNNPGAAYVLSDSNGCISILKALDNAGNTPPLYFGDQCMSANVIQALGASRVNGTKFTSADTTSQDNDARLFRAVMATYAPSVPTSGASIVGYQAMLSFLRAVANINGNLTAANVLQAIKSSRDVALALGHGLTFTCDGKTFASLPSICGSGALADTVRNGTVTGILPIS